MGFLVLIIELLCVMHRLYLTVIGIIIPLNCVIDKKILICLIYDEELEKNINGTFLRFLAP